MVYSREDIINQRVADIEHGLDRQFIVVEVIDVDYHKPTIVDSSDTTIESPDADTWTPISFTGAWQPPPTPSGALPNEVYLDGILLLQGKFTTGTVSFESVDFRLNDSGRQWTIADATKVSGSEEISDYNVGTPGDLLLVYVDGGDIVNSSKYALGSFPAWTESPARVAAGHPASESAPSALHTDLKDQVQDFADVQDEARVSTTIPIAKSDVESMAIKILDKVAGDRDYKGGGVTRDGAVVNAFIERDDDDNITHITADILSKNLKADIVRDVTYHSSGYVEEVHQTARIQTTDELYEGVVDIVYDAEDKVDTAHISYTRHIRDAVITRVVYTDRENDEEHVATTMQLDNMVIRSVSVNPLTSTGRTNPTTPTLGDDNFQYGVSANQTMIDCAYGTLYVPCDITSWNSDLNALYLQSPTFAGKFAPDARDAFARLPLTLTDVHFVLSKLTIIPANEAAGMKLNRDGNTFAEGISFPDVPTNIITDAVDYTK